MSRQNYYEILNISKKSTNKEINKAYKTLAKKYHPDITNKPATKLFTDIQEAYNILNNIKKKKEYDLEEYPDIELSSSGEIEEDIFDDFLTYKYKDIATSEGDTPRQRQRLQSPEKQAEYPMPASIELKFDITLEEIYNRDTKIVPFNRDIICNGCSGRKIDVKKYKHFKNLGYDFRCAKCKGSGKLFITKIINHAKLTIPITCEICRGKGIIIKTIIICNICYGLGLRNVSDNIKIDLSTFSCEQINHENKLQIKNIGNDTIFGKKGSVFLYINELNHDRFKRSSDGKDLLFIHKLSLYDALGCKKNRIIYIKMLDLKTIGIYISDKTIIKSRHIKKIKNQGMHIEKQLENSILPMPFGNMYIVFDIFFPDEIDIEKPLVDASEIAEGKKNNKFTSSKNDTCTGTVDSIVNASYQFEDLEDCKPSDIYCKFLIQKQGDTPYEKEKVCGAENECIIV